MAGSMVSVGVSWPVAAAAAAREEEEIFGGSERESADGIGLEKGVYVS